MDRLPPLERVEGASLDPLVRGPLMPVDPVDAAAASLG
jgi:hypothetical protein